MLKNQELAERAKNGTEEPVLSGMPLADMIRDPKRTLEQIVGKQLKEMKPQMPLLH